MSSSDTPSVRIDAAICNLLMEVWKLSDDYFDARFVCLLEPEAEELVIRLIEGLTSDLNGRLLASHLHKIRVGRESTQFLGGEQKRI